MKTLLLRPFTDSTIGNSPPLSIMYISSYLKSMNLEVKLMDQCVDGKHINEFTLRNTYIRSLVDDICDYCPDIIGMTLYSRELKEISKLCKLIKKEMKSVYIILGGPHPTAMPKETLEQITECDIVVRGEGEIIAYDLITALSSNKDLKYVKGISFRENKRGGVFHCEDADIITDLDTLPFPDRKDLIHNYESGKYGSLLYGTPSDTLMTSRGCPFNCSFCFKVCEKYRDRSPENVLKEIDWIMKNVSPQSIQIMDDSFTIQRDRCIKILDLLIDKNFPCKFKVRSRVNATDSEVLRKMKNAGVDTIVYGFESGSQAMLNAFNKKTNVEQNIRACQLTKRAGISCLGDMILFYPGESRTTLKETEQFIKKAQPTAVKFYVLTPLPNTKVYDESKESDRLIGDWNIEDETPWVKLDDFKDLSEMEKIAKKMFIRTILMPKRLLWILKAYGKAMLRNPFFSLDMVMYSIFKGRKY